MPCIICAIWEKINFFGIYVVKAQWIIGQKSKNSARYAGAFWGEKSLFGRKVNKVLCIIATIWGKINFLGVFGVKTQWIILQKSQNSARYAGVFWGKKLFFLEFLLYKQTGLLGKKVKIVLDMQAHLRKKSPFRGEKSIKCPVL